jgi:hypothetical protein
VTIRARSLLLVAASICVVMPSFAEIRKGDKLQAIANLHPDMQRLVLYTLNYQLPGLIPVCSEVTFIKASKKAAVFEYKGQQFEVAYEGFTKGAGIEFQQALESIFFGKACDKAKMEKLGKIDREGIKSGQPKVGMTRDGVLFAMGRPPFHANPDLTSNEWRYWRNRFSQMVVRFGDDGKVAEIR